ncbi:extracellular triacylglycerol lipase precursor [Armillaria borealis]|uniref:Carboxylic ester hydrolase n=1 Tax=Armillaria borealis TaxID=47425 RepID=A0AA39JV51_9AGAR|nr:extracellular triacylglycerol lipase precursor [Armillaria borealis]
MLIVISVLCYALFAVAAPEVQLGKTKLIGRDVTGLQQDFFGGIPFAEPPLGALRLQRPVLKTDIDADEFDARNFGLPCLQQNLDTDEMSEDCLTINVFRPKGASAEDPLPVMFWTYGGGFSAGSSSSFNGSNIVAQSVTRGTPIIYVNYNYRLGPLGFPQGQEADNRGQLNLGVRDVLTALEWVQQNIGLFGGDKTKVTIFGESAGAMLTNLVLLNASISDFAWAAVSMQPFHMNRHSGSLVRSLSGSASSPVIYNASTREINWEYFVAGTPGCESVAGTQDTFDCLQAANSSAIYQGFVEAYELAIEDMAFYPALDGPSGAILPDLPTRLWAKGQFATIPFISGTNLDEVLTRDTRPSAFPPYLSDTILDGLLELYPDDPSLGSPYGTGNETFGLPVGWKRVASMTGDLTFDAQRRTWTQTAAQAGVKAYGYQFTQNSSMGSAELGVHHASEIDFVYGQLNSSSEPASSILLRTSRPSWPQYTPENEVLLQLNGDNTTVIPDDYRKEAIEFLWDNADAFHR